jgi:carboxypeptidase C (cathepsin A)
MPHLSPSPNIPQALTLPKIALLLPALSSVVQSGVKTVIWAGDADGVCDWFGGFHSANAIEYAGQAIFANKPVIKYKVKGEVGGEFKSVGNLSCLRVLESGHEVPAFKPKLALQVFKQTMRETAIHST